MSRCDQGGRISSTGLSTVVDPAQPRLDIVFVHGFTGHPERTWSCPRVDRSHADPAMEPPSKRQKLTQSLQTITGRTEEKSASMVFWPRDLLPHTVSDARIFTYGYDTHIRHRLDSPALQTTVYDIAWDFLVALEGERRAEPLRPMIFVVHSLGGIVVKEMLRRSSGCSGGQAHLNQIFSSTKGIIFFGTPHGGADPRGLIHHIAEKLIRAIGVNFNKQVVNTLLPSSERLKELRDEFGPLADGQQWLIHSFQEQHGVAALGGAKVVEDISSYVNLPSREVTEHIERNHMEMCRFAEKTDPEYKKFIRALLRVVEVTCDQKQSRNLVLLSEEHKPSLLESLYFDQIDARQMSIKSAHAKTCKWLLRTPEYLDWIDSVKFAEHNGLLWIKGKPGAGKSTLMKFVSAHARKTMSDTIILTFFFNARGEELEKSTVGTYRSLLSQLLKQTSDLEIRFDSLWSPGQVPPSSTYHWSLEALTHFFKQVVQSLHRSSIVCFIDALDECEEAQIREMISFFEDLEQVCASSGTKFRLCFASRHYPHVNIEGGIELVLEGQEGHEQDVCSYLGSQLRIGKTKRAETIRSKVQEKASGVFMWVVLVVSILNKEFDRGSVHALDRKLQELPKDLHTLFREILTRDSHGIPELTLCLQWVLFAAKPLSPAELYFAILSGTSPEDIVPYDPEEIPLEVISRFLLDRSKGLTEITKSKQAKVQFIHESVRDFLLKEHGLASICSDLKDNAAAQSYEKLKICCLVYTNVASQSVDPLDRLKKENVSNEWPFLEHGIQHLIQYANMAQGGGIDQNEFLSTFPLSTWAMFADTFEKHEIRRYHNMDKEHSLLDILHIAVIQCFPALTKWALSKVAEIYKDLGIRGCFIRASTLQNVVERKDQEALATLLGCSFFTHLTADDLLRTEVLECLNLALQADNGSVKRFFNQKAAYIDRLGLIDVGIENGLCELVEYLFNLDTVPPSFRLIAWERAVIFGQIGIFKTISSLLTASEWDEIDNGKMSSALFWSGRKPCVDIVRILFQREYTAGRNIQGKIIELLLMENSLITYQEETKDLIKWASTLQDFDWDFQDVEGNTALHGLAHGNLSHDELELLLQGKEVQLDLKNNRGETPLSKAVKWWNYNMVKMLLASDQVDPDSRDNDGRSPLSWASYYSDISGVTMVTPLLDTGRVDVNSVDKDGQTPLSYATSDEVRELLRRYGAHD
ncbi:hypothetical protein GRF29_185g1063651 [Pseudopithomyces chartarum]|uniref:Nephrocystin 3-like N-terminal domain-containing protein n=1 Tax=Pseudopithomyces chartarum TaxID=1892770 RepID=A0AAN6LSU0_9PLEO|nr:hypothetical protein GRF29_185g1063651 [Pseudopithomyces chartarum]